MAKKKKINKTVVIILGSIIVLVLAGLTWHWREKIMNRLFPKDPVAAEKRGDESLAAGKFGQAMDDFREAYVWYRDPSQTAERNRAGMKKVKACFYRYNPQIDTDPSVTQTQRHAAGSEGFQTLVKMVRDDPQNVEARKMLCTIYWGQALQAVRDGKGPDWQSFLTHAGLLLQQTPQDHEVWFLMGRAHSQMAGDKRDKEEIQKAVDAYRKALSILKDESYYRELAKFYEWAGDNAAAEAVYKEAFGSVEPANRMLLRVGYAQFLRNTNRSDDCLTELQVTVKENPQKATAYIALANFWLAEAQNNRRVPDPALVAKAVTVLLEGLKASQDDPQLHSELARVYIVQQKRDEACALLRQGIARIDAALGKLPAKPAVPATQPSAAERERYSLEKARPALVAMLGMALMDHVEFTSGDTSAQLTEAKKCLKEIENSAKPQERARLAGRIALMENRLADAAGLLEQAHTLFKEDPENRVKGSPDMRTVNSLVRVYMMQQLRGKAESLVDEVLKADPNNVQWLIQKAKIQMDTKRQKEARVSLEGALRIDPANSEARNLLQAILAGSEGRGLPASFEPSDRAVAYVLERVRTLNADQKPLEAQTLLEQLYQKAPANRMVLARLYDVYMFNRQSDKARQLLQNAIAADPKDESLKTALRLIDAPVSERFASQMVMLDKVTDEFQKNLAKADLSQNAGNKADWEKYLKAADAAKPGSVEVLGRQFQAATATGDLAAAEGIAAKAKASNADGLNGLRFLGDLARLRDQYDQAISCYVDALKLQPNNLVLRDYLGQCYLKTNQVDKGWAEFDRCVKDDPAFASAIKSLAMIAQARGNIDEFSRRIERLHELTPDDPYVRENYLGVLARSIDTRKDALTELISRREQILRTAPDDMKNILGLAVLYEQDNRLQRAEELYRRVFDNATLDRRYRTAVLGEFLVRQKRYGDVDTIYAALLSEQMPAGEKVKAYLDYGRLLAQHSFDLAVAAYQKALDLDPNNPQPYREIAQVMAMQKKLPKAAEFLDRSLKVQDDATTRSNLAQIYMEMKDYPAALAQADKIIAANADATGGYMLKGAILGTQAQYDQAEKMFTKVLSMEPNNAQALLNRAQVIQALPDVGRAKLDLAEAQRMNRDPALGMQIARVYASMGDQDAAIGALLVVKDQQPRHREAIGSLINLYVARKELEKAQRLIDEAVGYYPNDAAIRLERAALLNMRGQKDLAMDEIVNALKLAPDNDRAVEMYLAALLNDKRYDQVIEAAKTYAAKESMAPMLATLTGRALVGLNQIPQADAQFKLALQKTSGIQTAAVVTEISRAYGKDSMEKLIAWRSLCPKSAEYRLRLGELMQGPGQDPQGAVAIFQEALALTADKSLQAELWCKIGTLYQVSEKIKSSAKAAEAYEKAIAANPNHLQSLNNLAYMNCEDLKDYAKAEDYGARAYRLAPADPNILDTYGWILCNTKKYAQAEPVLRKAVELGARKAVFLYHLGCLYEQTGQAAQARSLFEEAQKVAAPGDGKTLQQEIDAAVKRTGGGRK
ncbi:MAG: tetratricopeptide repeat protein [Planctomycetaceae bacterium]|nr:tetratricopeptide repeat protein [Planctomycetaceae bacterium]